MRGRIAKKIISLLSAAVMAASDFMPVTAVGESFENNSETAYQTVSSENELVYQSLELYPNGEDAEQVVTLDGIMPAGAEAEVIDVSDEHDGVAAYDITITDCNKEYQPNDSRPIFVEITDPVISKTESIELWHILDSGEREQITEFSVADGKLSFFATGFSVYEIVEAGSEDDLAYVKPLSDAGWQTVTGFDEYSERGAQGFYLGFYIKDSAEYYLTSNVVEKVTNNANRDGLESVTYKDIDTAAENVPKFYFVQIGQASAHQFKIYVNVGGSPKYLKLTPVAGNNSRGGLALVDSADDATVFTLENYTGNSNPKGIVCKGTASNNNTYWLNRNKNAPGVGAVVGYSGAGDDNCIRLTPHYSLGELSDDPFRLDNVSGYGLMEYTSGDSMGNGLIGDDTANFTRTYSIEVRSEEDANSRKNYFITDNTDITEWTFVYSSEDKYKLYDSANNRYLRSDGSSLSMTESAAEATAFQVLPHADNVTDARKRIQLKDKANGKYISFGENGFTLSNTGTDLWFVKKSDIDQSQHITYTADRISVSDGEKACDGQEIIIYTRIWNDENECYDFYAIDHDGSLKRCYAYGDKLMWMGEAINTVLWKFIVHTENDKENGYYDFQNVYSGKYLNPQFLQGGGYSVLSNTRPGVLLPGRTYEITSTGAVNYGEYYSTILSWDSDDYSYAALANNGTSAASAVKMSKAEDYYFAVINTVHDDTASELHKVATVDNHEYGIKSRIVNFPNFNLQNLSLTGKTSKPDWEEAKAYNPTLGLLTTDLKSNGYPETMINKEGGGKYSLQDLFAESELHNINHLFIQSVHDSSGYFEYDSCQNFATLKGGANGSYIPYTYTYLDENNVEQTETGWDFTVYKELGTQDNDNKKTLKHGQFFPYNTITPGNFAKINPENTYQINGSDIKEFDPRKYEKLHTIGNNPDYYFGVELEAKFVQTPSGLDAWGHDVIFEFTGDDDFWLYVDGELVLDLGGVHSAVEGKVNFRTGVVKRQDGKLSDGRTNYVTMTLLDLFRDNFTVRYKAEHGGSEPSEETLNSFLDRFFAKDKNGDYEPNFKDYSEHTMKIFYMERGAGASNLHMRFNLSSVTPGNVIFAKQLTAEDDEDLSNTDLSDVQFPFQIKYQKTDESGEWFYLTNKTADDTPSVSYQYSTQTVRYAAEYKSPNSDKTYNNVFFVNPGKPLEISFPENAMYYQIIECAVNKDIYDVGSASTVYKEDGTTETVSFDEEKVAASGNIRDLKMNAQRVKELPTIALENKVKKNRVQALDITKKLFSSRSKAEGTELYYNNPQDQTREDKTTFNYRLYLSNGTGGELKLASLREYYVLDTENRVCEWDAVTQSFVRYTSTAHPEGIYSYEITPEIKDEVVTNTSPYGSISNIPAGYTVRVPGLLAGTKFMVVERDYEIPTGYDLIDYECKTGYKLQSQNDVFTLTAKNLDGLGLDWSTDDTKLMAVYRSGILMPGYITEFANTESSKSIAFEYSDSKIALSAADQYEVYEISIEKGDDVNALADTVEGTLTAEYNWPGGGAAGDKVTLAVYDDHGRLMTDHIATISFPGTSAVFSFDGDGSNISNYRVHKVNVVKGAQIEHESNTELDLSYIVDNSYTVDGITYPLDPSSKKYYSAGTVREGVDSKVTVNNCRGFGIRADKVWSDSDFAHAHGDIYTAVYVDGLLLDGTVKRLESPNTTVQYYFEELPQNKHLSDYSIYEVEVNNPQVNADGFVTSYSYLRKLEKISSDTESDKISINATDKISKFILRAKKIWPEETADGVSVTVGLYDMKDSSKEPMIGTITCPDQTVDFVFNEAEDISKAASRYQVCEVTLDSGSGSYIKGRRLDSEIIPIPVPMEYTASYYLGTAYKTNENVSEENARKDIIKNTRKGGIEINLYKWNNTDAEDIPLEGGAFQIYLDVTTDDIGSMSAAERSQITEITLNSEKRYFKRINTYISDEIGNVTVLYNFQTGNYMLVQTAAPEQHIGIEKPIFFAVTADTGGVYSLDSWSNGNDTDNDRDHTSQDGKFWAEYDVAPQSGVLTAVIDIYNKPYTFNVKKVNSRTGKGLPNAVFELHREVMTVGGYAMEYSPLDGYEELRSGVNTGLIPKLDNTLPQGTYYLKETEAPTGFEKMSQAIRFSVTAKGIEIDNESEFGVLNTTESADGSHVTYVISVPNTPTDVTPSEYYFGIEKAVLIDKYVHNSSDNEQRFIFKVDRYDPTDTSLSDLLESFYVTFSCDESDSSDFDIEASTDGKFTYNSSEQKVTVYYSPGDNASETYTFPADVLTGSQLICAKEPGIFRITEVTDWSKTDYTFWKGSNRIKDSTAAPADDGSVTLTVTDAEQSPTACFANSEGEYAYLSSQSWASNSITKE